MARPAGADGCKDLATRIIDDAIKEIEENKRSRSGIHFRERALTWIFKDYHKTFEFWCDAANKDPDAVKKDLEQYR